jgi:hypothetical protein
MPTTPNLITGLKMWLKGDAEVYKDSGVNICNENDPVEWWYDQSGNGNHVFGPTEPLSPRYNINAMPIPGLSFIVTDGGSIATTFGLREMLMGSYSSDARSFTVMAVVMMNSVDYEGQIMSFDSTEKLAISTLHGYLYVRDNGILIPTGIKVTSDKLVIVWRSNVTGMILYVNQAGNVSTVNMATAGTYNSGTLGSIEGPHGTFFDMYELAIWNNDIGSTNAALMLEYAVSRHEIKTEDIITKRIYIDGDYISEGAGDQLNLTYWRRAYGAGSQNISLISFANKTREITAADVNAQQYIDPRIAGDRIENWLFYKIGLYNFGPPSNDDGLTVYTKVKEYCTNRRLAGFDKIVIFTEANIASDFTDRDDYNELLRNDFGEMTEENQHVFKITSSDRYADYLVDLASHDDIGTANWHNTYWSDLLTAYNPLGAAIHASLVTAGLPRLFEFNGISVPVDPIAVHVGHGVVQIHADFPLETIYSPESGTYVPLFKEFEVEASPQLNGPYQPFSNNRFENKDGFVYNFPQGQNVHLRIRSVGTNNAVSDWMQIRKGILSRPIVDMECRAVRGSIIPAGAMFTMPKNKSRVIGFIVQDNVEF